ncbi:MAPEG family protein [Limimonas halophila]|uniref:MAPEG family protein n=1 Tax=Limimonas halophila TaxID=1082479 RepID=A0A1G7S6U2_9PROT|nr:MAPEG family protein [Limimonas halophila]SDG18745.1 MAPEG family protein [Limimonas halophila]
MTLGVSSWLTADRQRSLAGGTIGMGTALLALAVLFWLSGAPEIMGAVAWALLVPASLVFLFVLATMAARMHTRTFDPTAGREPRAVQVTGRVLTNTLEQSAIFVPATVVIALNTGPALRDLVPALAITFLAARLAFWIGYLIAPQARAPGMGATLAVNVVALVTAIVVA